MAIANNCYLDRLFPLTLLLDALDVCRIYVGFTRNAHIIGVIVDKVA